jgi:hypothetical protein
MLIKIVLTVILFLSLVYFFIKKNKNIFLLSILLGGALNVVALFTLKNKVPNLSILSNNLYMVITHGVFLYMIVFYYFKELKNIVLVFLAGLSLYHFIDIGVSNSFWKIFYFATIIPYLILFIVLCSRFLQEDNLEEFYKSKFILTTSPISTFIGMGLVFSFPSGFFSRIQLTETINLYNVISFFALFVTSALQIYYIHKSSNENHGN